MSKKCWKKSQEITPITCNMEVIFCIGSKTVSHIYIGDRQKEDQNMMTYNHQFQGHEKNAL